MDLYILDPADADWFSLPVLYSETGKFLSVKRLRCSHAVRLLVAMRIRRRAADRVAPEWNAPTLSLPGGGALTIDDAGIRRRD
jgi:hypothetical protein